MNEEPPDNDFSVRARSGRGRQDFRKERANPNPEESGQSPEEATRTGKRDSPPSYSPSEITTVAGDRMRGSVSQSEIEK